jgi:4-hydroxybenzoate polyprenyltransferase
MRNFLARHVGTFMQKVTAYLQLMRFDKPIGIFLLLWPTYWALWIASNFSPDLKLIAVFGLGVVVMRAAGCVINDIADRHIDKHVERTQNRPLTSGRVSLQGALFLLFSLLFIALLLVTQLNRACFYLAIAGSVLTLSYPFFKRFFKAPQLVLGFAFSWGIPMAFMAVQNQLTKNSLLLMLLTFCWIIVYDTMYAIADKKDDLAIGVNSTAILMGNLDIPILISLQLLIQGLWLVLFTQLALPKLSLLFWLGGFSLFAYQQYLIKDRVPQRCFQAFLNNHWYGMTYWLCFFIVYRV